MRQRGSKLTWECRSEAVFSLSYPKGGEGRGEEADYFKLKSPHPNPLPAWAGRGGE
jgi:hypothetical protein